VDSGRPLIAANNAMGAAGASASASAANITKGCGRALPGAYNGVLHSVYHSDETPRDAHDSHSVRCAVARCVGAAPGAG
jgi:hypothetical protein